MALLLAGAVSAAALPPTGPRIRSVVRADAQGRLIRSVVVLQPNVVTLDRAAEPDSSQAAEAPSVPDLVEAVAKRYDVDPLLVHSVIQVESSYNPYAVSIKGAQGLMQLMPATARRFGVRNSFDVKENIEGGVRYLKYLDSLFPNDRNLTIAAYNAGEGAVWKYGNKVPPYRETEQYVQRVGMRYGKARREADRRKVSTRPAVQTAQVSEPPQAPVEAFVDSDGRLHLRNVPTADPSSEQHP
ncbi:MAG TPA: lytic transglycosylase domain-containing protein [Bryobacteraceae bacterium]|nr:lytic transglycosylase domain-containing protein [Bryobacteraceae bacterium]